MRTGSILVVAWIGLVLVASARGQDSFVRGHLYVSVAEPETCDFGGREWIVEIDPKTGDWSIFADSDSDSDDAICVVTGLRFTPDGTRLLALNFGHYGTFLDGGWVTSYAPDGTSEIILDASDGLRSPSGANGLAFDKAGDLYVGSGDTLAILRYPGGAAPPTVFADGSDGISFQGAIDFAPNGDLFYASHRTGTIVRITPNGQSSLFDALGAHTLVIDELGRVFAATGPGDIYRYDDPSDPSSRRTLATGFFNCRGALGLGADTDYLYYGECAWARIYRIDANDGTSVLVADLKDLPEFFYSLNVGGMAVYAPDFPEIPTISAWGTVLMTLLVLSAATISIRRRKALVSCSHAM